MAPLLSPDPPDGPVSANKTSGWRVGGVWFANSAARFWASLLRECADVFPGGTLHLYSYDERPLARDLLEPTRSLQNVLDRLPECDLGEAMRDALLELEIAGPPRAVAAEVRQADRVLLQRDLPRESVDAETFPLLLAWLPEWAAIREEHWNDSVVDGEFAADAGDAVPCPWRIAFRIANRHLSEGLWERTVEIAGVYSGNAGPRQMRNPTSA